MNTITAKNIFDLTNSGNLVKLKMSVTFDTVHPISNKEALLFYNLIVNQKI